MKQTQRLESLFKIQLPENWRQYGTLVAIISALLIVLVGVILTLVFTKVMPLIPSAPAGISLVIVIRNAFFILLMLVFPSAVAAWLLSRIAVMQRRMKRRLRMNEQVFKMVDDSIYVHKFGGECIYASGPDRKNGNHNNKPGSSEYIYNELIHPRIESLLETGELTFESIHNPGDKEPVVLEVHCRLIKSDNQNSVVSVIHDITERKRTEEELFQSSAKIIRAMNGTISSMASIAEVRDPYTAGHQQRVARLAAAIAGDLGLSEERIEGVRVAGTLHDIGKISVPSEILSKPGKLRKSEFDLIKDHSEIGYELLKTIEFSRPVAQIVLQHHERMDGSGYPNRLTGENILLEARIMGVSDVIESMCSHRPYRPAFSIEKALLEIIMKKGVLYDPQVVDTCVRLFNDKGFTFD